MKTINYIFNEATKELDPIAKTVIKIVAIALIAIILYSFFGVISGNLKTTNINLGF